MNPTIKSDTEQLKCTSISLQFQSKHLAESFIDCLLRLQLSHIEREGGRIGVHGPLSNGTLPSSLQPRPPTELGVNEASSSSFVSLPHIPHTEPLDDSLFRASRELQACPAPGGPPQIQELVGNRRPYGLPVPTELGESGGVHVGNMSELPSRVDAGHPN